MERHGLLHPERLHLKHVDIPGQLVLARRPAIGDGELAAAAEAIVKAEGPACHRRRRRRLCPACGRCTLSPCRPAQGTKNAAGAAADAGTTSCGVRRRTGLCRAGPRSRPDDRHRWRPRRVSVSRRPGQRAAR